MSDRLYFLRLLAKLETNAPSQTRIELGRVSWDMVGYGGELGAALLHNTVVTYLELNVMYLAGKYDETNHSMTVNTLRSHTNDLVPLFNYLRTTSSLEQLTFLGRGSRQDHPVSRQVLEDILDAVAQNPHRLALCCHTWMPLVALAKFLKVTSSVHRLDLQVDLDGFDDSVRQLLPEAFGINKSLEELRIVGIEASNKDIVGAILERLAGHSKLRVLLLKFTSSAPLPLALSTLLQPSFSKLEEVTLIGLRRAVWKCLNLGLETGRIPKLNLIDCPFEKREAKAFLEWMQSCSRRPFQVTDLSIHHCSSMEDCMTEPPFLSLLFSAPLQAQIRTRVLRMNCLFRVQLQAIAYYLPLSVYMRELSVYFLAYEGTLPSKSLMSIPAEYIEADTSTSSIAGQLLEGVRRNGSLLAFHFLDRYSVAGKTSRNASLLSGQMNAKVQAYMERNQRIPELLCDADDHFATNVDTTNHANVWLFPALFSAANAAPAMAPTNLLIGLLAFKAELIGPQHW
jgi:hypothetical protein